MKISKITLLIAGAIIGFNSHAQVKEINCSRVIIDEKVRTVYESSLRQTEGGVLLVDVKKLVMNEIPHTIISETKTTWGPVGLDEIDDLDYGAAVYQIEATNSSKIIFQATFPSNKDQSNGTGFSFLFDANPSGLVRTDFDNCTLTLQ